MDHGGVRRGGSVAVAVAVAMAVAVANGAADPQYCGTMVPGKCGTFFFWQLLALAI